jgi:DNA-binding Lrp family transcriptional regulator
MGIMPKSTIVMDDLDRQIVLALQLNGRASWKQVAQALDVPESTVTRRGQALLASRTVAVTGVLDHLRCGLGISVYMRFRSRPGRALAVARAVAELSTPRFVTVMTGSFDVAAEVVVKSHRDLTTVLTELDCLDDVLESESMVVIRKFTAFEEWDPGTLGGSATDVLRSGGTVTDYAHRDWVEPEQLSDQEFQIARVLANDGRATYAAVAARTGVSESTAARRVESLVKRGCLRFRTLFDASSVGLDVEFLLWLTVEPEHVDEVGERLAKQPSTRYVSAATGRYNMILQGVLPGYGDLYPYTTHVIGELPGVVSADLTLQVHTLKRAWVPMDEDGRPATKEIS